jgi:hypothetical protein
MPVCILNGVCDISGAEGGASERVCEARLKVKNPGKSIMKIEDATILCRAQNDKIGLV